MTIESHDLCFELLASVLDDHFLSALLTRRVHSGGFEIFDELLSTGHALLLTLADQTQVVVHLFLTLVAHLDVGRWW